MPVPHAAADGFSPLAALQLEFRMKTKCGKELTDAQADALITAAQRVLAVIQRVIPEPGGES
jgi:hypothetical protein